jgi:hypothetical protein
VTQGCHIFLIFYRNYRSYMYVINYGVVMPISFQKIDDKYIVLNCEGDVSVDDFVKVNEYIYSNVDESIARYQIVDLSAVTNIVMSTEDIEKIADQDKNAEKFLGQIAIAVVAVKDFDFGLSRMWEAYTGTSGIDTMVFRDLLTAQKWILRMLEKQS